MILIDETPLDKLQFPDGTYHIRCEKATSPVRITWQYESDEELFQLYCISRHLQESASHSVTLYLPYLPNARMDRVKGERDVFTLKYFCEIINALHFEKVEVLDVHSNVSLALLNRVKPLSPKPYLDFAIQQIREEESSLILYFPDEGACKRYIDLYPNMPYCFGMKNRHWETGKILGLDIITNGIDLNGENILMVDDICSYGGTLYYSAKALLHREVRRLYSFTTHTENSLLSDRSKYLQLLRDGIVLKHFTTSSLYHKEEAPWIKVISTLSE